MREPEEERKDCLNNPIGLSTSVPEQQLRTPLTRGKKAILSLLKTMLAQLPLLSINFILLGSGSFFFSDTATIDKKTINGHHAQATVSGHLSNNNTTTGLLDQKYIQLLEEKLQDKEELVESLKLLVESQQRHIVLLEEVVKKLRRI